MSLHSFSKDFISNCVADQDAYAHLCRLCDDIGPRLSATSAEAKAVDSFIAYMSQLGYETEIQEFTYDAWQFGSSTVRVAKQGEWIELSSNPLGWSAGNAVTAPLIDAGHGVESELRHLDVTDRVVLVSDGVGQGQKGVHRSVKYTMAVEAGASGFLFYPNRPGGLVPMGSINLDAKPGTIPAAGISYEDALALRRAGSPEVELRTMCRIESSVSRNGFAVKAGAAPGEIIVCGHIDTWNSPGAVDDGSGIVAMMELARLLEPYKLNRSVRFVAFGSEELGLHGSKHFVAAQKDLSDIFCVLNVDCVAIGGGTLGVTTQDTPSFHSFWESVKKDLNLEFVLSRESTMYSDHHPFREKGVPAAALLSKVDGGLGFAHTAYDTLDKLDRQSFTIPLLVSGVAIIELAMTEKKSFRE